MHFAEYIWRHNKNPDTQIYAHSHAHLKTTHTLDGSADRWTPTLWLTLRTRPAHRLAQHQQISPLLSSYGWTCCRPFPLLVLLPILFAGTRVPAICEKQSFAKQDTATVTHNLHITGARESLWWNGLLSACLQPVWSSDRSCFLPH